MDINELRKTKTPNQQRIADLRRQQRDLLKDQREVAKSWNEELVDRNLVQTSNIRRQQRAVFLSQQPGQIDYRITPPDPIQATDYKRRAGSMETLQKNIEGLAEEIRRLEQDEKKKNEARAKQQHGGSLLEWKRNYGSPKRKSSKEEKWLSFVKPPTRKVRGAVSRDQTINYPATQSCARFLRKGKLTE